MCDVPSIAVFCSETIELLLLLLLLLLSYYHLRFSDVEDEIKIDLLSSETFIPLSWELEK
jgi:hypothetical protein